MFIWIESPEGKKTFVNDHEIDPCEDCGEFIGTCRENDCVEGWAERQAEQGCFWCGAPNTYACRCDNDYESRAGK
jgi:hypothetical protein